MSLRRIATAIVVAFVFNIVPNTGADAQVARAHSFRGRAIPRTPSITFHRLREEIGTTGTRLRGVAVPPVFSHLGTRSPGPPMLLKPPDSHHAHRDPHAMAGAMQLPAPLHTSPIVRRPEGLAGRVAVSPLQRGARHILTASTVDASQPSYTGINSWWTYEEDTIPGIGKYIANVGLGGNLIVQVDDMAIANPGVELAFRRTYNSLSNEDTIGTDGLVGNFGNGWTNTFDGHLVLNSGNQYGPGISVFDIDGARYDYFSDGNGNWVPPPGQYGQLSSDGQVGMFWKKKSGTVYYFYTPFVGTLLPQDQAYAGRFYVLFGRNYNTNIQFRSTWDNNDSGAGGKIRQEIALTQSGLVATINYADFAGHRLAANLVWPDGTTVTYSYDMYGNLIEADEPANNTAAPASKCQSGSPCLPQQYKYYSMLPQSKFSFPNTLPQGRHFLNFIGGARSIISTDSNGANPTDGSYLGFGFDSSSTPIALNGVGYYGAMNPTPSDGTNSTIQPAQPSGYTNYRLVSFARNPQTNTMAWSDSDGHQTVYTYDGVGRVTQRQEWTGSVTLATSQGWTPQNELSYSTDARGNQTDYGYDHNGNTIAVAAPQVSTSAGRIRPTSLYSYDGYNNVTAYCDPKWSNVNGQNWVTTPGDNDGLCPAASGTTRYTFGYPGDEPWGQLVQSVTPLGSSVNFSYDPGAQGGSLDYGLVTNVQGAVVPATQRFTYDQYGNIASYDKGTGASWKLSYDGRNWLTKAIDPDGVASYKYYYPNGAVSNTETAYQHAYGMGVTYQLDADGNVTSETHHHDCIPSRTCTPGITTKWYDSADRLIEVSQPQQYEAGGRWLTRYIYDLAGSANGKTVSLANGAPFSAYGNLYATREYIGSSWTDLKGTAYDALDRVTQKLAYRPCDYTLAPPQSGAPATPSPYQRQQTFADSSSCSTLAPSVTSLLYDSGSSGFGLLGSMTDPLAQATSYTFDELGRQTIISFSGDGGVTPGRTTAYDEDGRTVFIASSVGTHSYTYDLNGRTLLSTQPLTTGGSATMSYSYYDNGLKRSLGITSSALAINVDPLKTWSYRTDGLLTNVFLRDNYGWTYSPAGRPTSFADPFNTARRSYDAITGLLNSHDIAAGTYGNITHDFEGSIESYTAYGGQTVNFSFTPIGQLSGQSFTPGAYDDNGNNMWPDTSYFYDRGNSTGSCTDSQCLNLTSGSGLTGDVLTGATLATHSFSWNGCRTSSGGAAQCGYQIDKLFAYDAAGRQNADKGSYNTLYLCGPYKTPDLNFCTTSGTGSGSSSYDAENHLLRKSSNVPACDPPGGRHFGGGSYVSHRYGLVGRPILVGSHSVVWDGDEILLTANSTGQIDDLKVGLVADYPALSGGGPTVWDRDPSDIVASSHNASGHGGWAPPNPYHRCSVGPPPNAPSGSPNYSGFVPAITEPGSDGYFDGVVAIQGARTYDPQLSAWTAPDAYAGDVHDPMSQKPYMWNRNNPIDYSDPSGFDPGSSSGDDAGLQNLSHITKNAVGSALSESGGHPTQFEAKGFLDNVAQRINSALQKVDSKVRVRVQFEKLGRPVLDNAGGKNGVTVYVSSSEHGGRGLGGVKVIERYGNKTTNESRFYYENGAVQYTTRGFGGFRVPYVQFGISGLRGE